MGKRVKAKPKGVNYRRAVERLGFYQ